MTPVWGFENDVLGLVARLCDMPADFGRCRTMAVIRSDGLLAAGLIFHNWNPQTGIIEVSAAAMDPKWATRTVLNEALDYCFRRAGCQMVVARTHEDNIRVRRLWKALGATELLLPRMRGRNEDEAALLLTDDAWFSSRFASAKGGAALRRANQKGTGTHPSRLNAATALPAQSCSFDGGVH